MKTWIKPVDIIIIILAAGLVFFSTYTVYIKPQGRATALIRAQDGEWTFPLSADEKVVAAGPLGDTVVRLRENRAWIESSPCGSQTCTAAGFLSRHGHLAACLPNNVLLIIYGAAEDSDVDGIAW